MTRPQGRTGKRSRFLLRLSYTSSGRAVRVFEPTSSRCVVSADASCALQQTIGMARPRGRVGAIPPRWFVIGGPGEANACSASKTAVSSSPVYISAVIGAEHGTLIPRTSAQPLRRAPARGRSAAPGRPTRRQRPRRCRAAEQRDELAPLHSITSSAATCSVSGTVRPSPLAAFKLMTSSNFVACTTGRSLGWAPLRIRPT